MPSEIARRMVRSVESARTKNHFEAKFRATTSTVHTTEEIFFVGLVGDSASKAVITATVGSSKQSSQVQFQMDTGSECNVLPLRTYCRATGDRNMRKRYNAVLTSTPGRTPENDIRYLVLFHLQYGDVVNQPS